MHLAFFPPPSGLAGFGAQGLDAADWPLAVATPSMTDHQVDSIVPVTRGSTHTTSTHARARHVSLPSAILTSVSGCGDDDEEAVSERHHLVSRLLWVPDPVSTTNSP